MATTVKLCLPGDDVPAVEAGPGSGVLRDLDGFTYATTAGVLRTGVESSVENLRQRYIPRTGDRIVGIVSARLGEKYKVDIRAPASAYLPTLSFNGASRRNRPALEIGSLVYAWVEDVQPDHTELSCVDPETKKAWNTGEVLFGELKEGLTFEVTLSAAQRMLAADCFVLDRLGEDFAFESCAGHNGRIWLVAPTAEETVKLLQCVRRSFGMTDVQVEAMVSKMVEFFS
mmetsp:Transcript_2225/g.6338  ORF Transcript_2225/g.6338 Transcript_2225/m.6338 type:complete len:229 (-) Transcript_2225:101-787(-)